MDAACVLDTLLDVIAAPRQKGIGTGKYLLDFSTGNLGAGNDG